MTSFYDSEPLCGGALAWYAKAGVSLDVGIQV